MGPRGLGIEVKRLRVALLRECPDLFLIDPVPAAHKPLPDLQVFQEESRFLGV